MSDLVTRLSVLAEDDGDRYPAHVKKLAEAAASRIAALEAQLAARTGGVKPLEWEDADKGMCTKWRAAALGGHYELVAFEGEDGFAVNFSWGRPLSFWFIQGEPDEWGPTGPKMFPSLDEAKAAAQADFESRIRSALSPASEMEPVAWHPIETAPKDGTWILVSLQFADGDHPSCVCKWVPPTGHKHGPYGPFVWATRDSASGEGQIAEKCATHWRPIPAPPKAGE